MRDYYEWNSSKRKCKFCLWIRERINTTVIVRCNECIPIAFTTLNRECECVCVYISVCVNGKRQSNRNKAVFLRLSSFHPLFILTSQFSQSAGSLRGFRSMNQWFPPTEAPLAFHKQAEGNNSETESFQSPKGWMKDDRSVGRRRGTQLGLLQNLSYYLFTILWFAHYEWLT